MLAYILALYIMVANKNKKDAVFLLAGYIQVSQVPFRDEPDSGGEINYPFIFQQIAKLGYTGWIGAEYSPRGNNFYLEFQICSEVYAVDHFINVVAILNSVVVKRIL